MSNAARRAKAPPGPRRGGRSAHEALPPRGSLALGLINTETISRGKQHDALTSPEALAQWWAEARTRYPDQCAAAGAAESVPWTPDLFDAVRALRMALRTLAMHAVEGRDVRDEELTPINEILALGYVALERTGAGQVKAVTHARDPEKGSILLPIALSAVQLFAESDLRRLHQCRSGRCIVFFYDTTRSGTRRWCSPGCMNRDRSIQHYRMTRALASPTDGGA